MLAQETGSDDAALASAHEALAGFGTEFEAARLAGLRRKLGLTTEREGDAALAEHLLERMATNRADFTLTFRRLCDAAAGPEGDEAVRVLFAEAAAYDAWAAGWRPRLEEESVAGPARAAMMRRASPAFIPRNHLVEVVLKAATPSARISTRSRNCWRWCRDPGRTGQTWSDTARRLALRNASAQRSAGPKGGAQFSGRISMALTTA